jgi:integrase
VKLTTAIDRYVTDMVREGRFTSPHSELAYRTKLMRLAEHVRNRDPRTVGRVDIKTVLAQWPNPASQNQAHAVYASVFDWCLTEPRDRNERETICTTNPARRVRRAKARQAQVFRMTRSEVVAFLDASLDRQRDRWVAHLGCCAGLRSQEIRGLQGRHFERPGYVWVSREIGKGGKERWVPVIDDLLPIVAEVLEHVDHDRFVIPGRRSKGYPTPGEFYDVDKPVSASAVFKQVVAIGERAGIPGRVTPHTLRHAYGDHIARHAGLRVAQALMGHERVDTTASTYVQRPGMEELAAQVRGFSFRRDSGVIGLPEVSEADMAHG